MHPRKNTYRKHCIPSTSRYWQFLLKRFHQCVRYSNETLEFWLIVQKLFKGKGVNFFRGFKAQGLNTMNETLSSISPIDCRINFSVPSNPTLSKETFKYYLDAGSPGLLNIPLDAFANVNKGKDVKLSIDGKKLAIGLGDNGDENLGGFEVSPTLMERKDRLKTETDNLTIITSRLKETFVDGVEKVDKMEGDFKGLMKQSLLISITHMSRRIKELREFVVKRKQHLQNLLKLVEGDWKQSKLSGAISYWQTKLIHAQSYIAELLECIDISCINGTSDNYILGNKTTILLDKQSIYVCLRETKQDILLDAKDSSITKQRTDIWLQLRKESRVTGSTLFRALGLATLREQQEHFDCVYHGIERPISDKLQSFFDYGTREELNALGTLLGKIVPVYFPQLTYIEDGCELMDLGDSRAIISGDGTGITREKINTVAFEFKCPIPGKKYKTDLHYSLPVRYTTQILSQMAVKKCESLAFVSFTPESVSYIHADMDPGLWSHIWRHTEDLYGSINKSRPTKRNQSAKPLLEQLEQYSKNCSFIAEFPSLKAVPCTCQPTEKKDSVFGHHMDGGSISNESFSIGRILAALDTSKQAINQAYDLLRKPAKEVLVTVISDLERQARSIDSVAHAVPIHYGLSGFSLNMKTVRGILREIVNAICDRDHNVKAVAFDGQFLELFLEDEDEKSLTICRFMKQFWESVKKIEKNVKKQYLLDMYNMPKIETMDDVFRSFEYTRKAGNGITLKLKSNVKTLGSPQNITTALKKNKQLSSVEREPNNDTDENVETTSQQDILQFLPDEVIASLDDESIDILRNIGREKSVSDDRDSHNEAVENIKSEDYEEALISLIAMSGDEATNGYSVDEFREIFTDAKRIKKILTVPELKMLAGLSRQSPKCPKDLNKSELVNLISKLFGEGSELDIPITSPKSLRVLASSQIKSWSIEGINVAYAQFHFLDAFKRWDASNLFNGAWNISTEDGKNFVIPQWYAQPAKIDDKIFQTIIDPHHIFINNRSKCCSQGMRGMGIAAEAWWEVAKNSRQNRTGLSWEIAKELGDRQSNSYAQTTFSENVQLEMEKNGNQNEAQWCRLIRHWYNAVDDAGFSVETRLQYLLEMRTYLLGFFKTWHFPPVGSYVAGMPMAQFEGILCNVDRRLQLYAMVKESSYNQRSVTSLDSETFFSGFQDYDPKGTGVLRADDIPTALGTAVFIYKQRLDPNRKFHMKTLQKTRVYPVKPLGLMNQEVVLNEPRYDPFVERIIRIRSHHFDTVQRLSGKPKRKSGIISSFGKPAKGAEGARAFHKANEEKIMSHRRCGLNDEDLLY